jgi:hypothetical protein
MARRTRLFWLVVVALLAVAGSAPASASSGPGDQSVEMDLLFTQLEPVFDPATGDLITPPGGEFTMSGDGAVCDGGAFYEEVVNAVADTDDFQTYLNLSDRKFFTCDNGETFALDFYVEFEIDRSQGPEIDEFSLVFSTWTVSESSIFGLTGSGEITYRNWPPGADFAEETWSGVFGVYICKKGTWETMTDHLGTPFRNQGDCVSYFATDGRNLADG